MIAIRDPHSALGIAFALAFLQTSCVEPATEPGPDPSALQATNELCGNAVVDEGEACDTAIAADQEGSCPVACDDEDLCTADALAGANCTVMCRHQRIVEDQDDDGCCLQGSNSLADSDCPAVCGNALVEAGELCDTGIAQGEEGACPTACDDSDPCTQDELAGGPCTPACDHQSISEPFSGDGCCPQGSNSLADSDCPAVCGNALLEPGELCDTGIAQGEPGACPTACDDTSACTLDQLVNADTCQAVCVYEEITSVEDGDGCCPSGHTIATDSDCSAACGDGVVSPEPPDNETCDTAIATPDPGACPTLESCNDNEVCTSDSLVGGGTCQAICANSALSLSGETLDDCCPSDGNWVVDKDCPPVCGNGVRESTEQCDDGNQEPGDGCDACVIEATAFRFDSMTLADPHFFADFGGGCDDINLLINQLVLPMFIENDKSDPPDGLLDMNIVAVFLPLDLEGESTMLDLDVQAACTAPMATTECTAGPTDQLTHTSLYNREEGTCLEPLDQTTNPSYADVVTPNAPCFVSQRTIIDVDLQVIGFPLEDARLAATYESPERLTSGLMVGFLSEEAANAISLPSMPALPALDGVPFASLLPGGTGSCAPHDDRDQGPDGNGGVTTGWYFHLNFTASPVPYIR